MIVAGLSPLPAHIVADNLPLKKILQRSCNAAQTGITDMVISKASGCLLISFSLFDKLQTDTLQDQRKLLCTDRHGCAVIGSYGPFKAAAFQSFVVQCEAITFPLKKLDVSCRPVDEYKNITCCDLTAHASQ
jgi:hypothetical protein